jgi:hypothetical protein
MNVVLTENEIIVNRMLAKHNSSEYLSFII